MTRDEAYAELARLATDDPVHIVRTYKVVYPAWLDHVSWENDVPVWQ